MGEESELRTETNESNKRKIEEGFEIAKQKAQEIAARLNSEAESKRPRFDSHSSEPVLYSNPPLSEIDQEKTSPLCPLSSPPLDEKFDG